MRLRTINEAAEELGISRYGIRRGIESGKYPAISWRRRTLVDMDELAPIVEDELKRKARREDMIGLRECAEAIGISANTLKSMAVNGFVPYEKRGRYYRFCLKDVISAIQESRDNNGT